MIDTIRPTGPVAGCQFKASRSCDRLGGRLQSGEHILPVVIASEILFGISSLAPANWVDIRPPWKPQRSLQVK